MFAQFWRWPLGPVIHASKARRSCRRWKTAEAVLAGGLDDAACCVNLGVDGDVGEGLGGGPGDFLGGKARGHLVLREACEGFVEQSGHGGGVVAAGLSVQKAWIGVDAREVEGAGHARQVGLAGAGDDADPRVVLGAEEVCQGIVRLCARARGGDAAEKELDREIGVQRVEARAQQAYVDKLALARLQRLDQRSIDGGDGGDAGGVVARCCAYREEFGAFRRGEAREAGAGPEARDVETGCVGVRPFEAVAGQRAVDELRVAFGENLVAEARPLDAAGADIGQEDIGRVSELADDLAALLCAGVDDNGFLAAVVAVEGWIVGQVRQGRALCGEVGAYGIAAGRFDLYDFRAPIRQDPAGPRRGKICRVFNDFDAFKEQSGLPILCAGSPVFGPAVNMC